MLHFLFLTPIRFSALRPLRSLVAGTVVFALSACGGGGSSSSGGSGTAAIAITSQPAAQTVVEGQSAIFSVATNTSTGVGYQWRRNGVDLAGATAASYTTPALQTSDSATQYSVRATNGSSTATSAAAAVQVLSEVATAPTRTASVAPSVTASGISDSFGTHYVAANTGVSPRGLFVFFPGTGAVPDNYKLVVQAAANNGYAAIGLAYPNDSTVTGACLNSGNTDCTRLLREETLSGNNVSPVVSVSPTNAIRNRLTALLAYLAQQQPQEGWGRFVDAGGNLQWSQIRVGGHSQGGGTAVHLSKQTAVDRACFFAAPGDTTDAQLSVAPWVAAAGVTGAERLYGFAHEQDGIIPNSLVLQQWAALQLGSFGAALRVDGANAPYSGRHMLLTNVPRGNLLTAAGLAFHNLPVVDFFTPMEGNLPAFRRVWQYLCFTP